jgi:CRISPR-associated protein Cmr5
MRTLEQERAANALQCVKGLEDNNKDFKTHYRSYVERLGPAIVMNGLGQALASEVAAAGGENGPDKLAHQALYNNVSAWLCRSDGGVYLKSKNVLESIVQCDEESYLRAQAEALAWLGWHKKFCRAFLAKAEREE